MFSMLSFVDCFEILHSTVKFQLTILNIEQTMNGLQKTRLLYLKCLNIFGDVFNGKYI